MNDPNELGRHEGYDCLAQHIKELEARAETAERELKAERQVFSAELDRHKIRFEQIEAALAVEAAGHALVKAERDDAKKCLAMVTADMMEVDARADKYEAAYKACDWERQVVHGDLGQAKLRIKQLEDRLQIDPGGSDKIDELEQALIFVRHSLKTTQAICKTMNTKLTRIVEVCGVFPPLGPLSLIKKIALDPALEKEVP